MGPSHSPAFRDAMTAMSSLVEQDVSRRRSNLATLAAMTARLDDLSSSPSTEGEATLTGRHSATTPTRAGSDDDALRERIPARTNRNGGPYGASILARVAANYGIE